MRFKKYLRERIQNPPRDFNKYMKIKLKQLDVIVKKAYKMLDVVKKAMKDDEMYDFFKYATNDELVPDDYLLGKIIKFLDADVMALSYDLRQLKDVKDDRTIEVIFKSLVSKLENEYEIKYIRDQIVDLKRVFKEQRKRIDQTYKDYMEYEPDKKYTESYNYLKDMVPFFDDLMKWYDDLKVKIIELNKYRFHEYKPEYGDVEELYHATMYSKEILGKGFQKNIPVDRIGLGGATKGISMTSDLKIAMDISRFLKEVIMIFKGKLKYRHIVDWMNREGIDPKKWTYKKEPENVLELAKFYEYYLWMSKIRTVPVTMWSDSKAVKSFARRKASDVAILKCKVNMKHPDIEYHKGEREFRVPPEAVLECKKI